MEMIVQILLSIINKEARLSLTNPRDAFTSHQLAQLLCNS